MSTAAVTTNRRRFLSGPLGAGKTTAALAHLHQLLRQERVRGDDILVLLPQRSLAAPYREALRATSLPPGSAVRVTTFASLAQQAVELYWPLLAPTAGFADPGREPTFSDARDQPASHGAAGRLLRMKRARSTGCAWSGRVWSARCSIISTRRRCRG
jgi:hypothetical protein